MFKELFSFELRSGFKKWSTQIYFFVFLTLGVLLGLANTGAFDTSTSDSILTKNSSLAIARLIVGMSGNIMVLINGIIMISIMATAIQKDYEYNFHGLLYTTPITKSGYFFGRFSANFLIANYVFSGILIGYFFGSLYGVGTPQLGPINIINYIWPFLVFTVANTLIIGSIFFSLTTITRSTLAGYLFCVILLLLSILSDSILSDIENKDFVSLIDPFGNFALRQVTEYWTPYEQNENTVALSGVLLWNRLLWIGIALLCVGVTYFKFDFNQFLQPFSLFGKKKTVLEETYANSDRSLQEILNVQKDFGWIAKLKELFYLSFFEVKRIVYTPFFRIIAFIFGVLLIVISNYMKSMYDAESIPVTFLMAELGQDGLSYFLLLLIVFFSGNIVGRERESKIDELISVTTVSNFNLMFSKFLGMVWMVLIMQIFTNLICVGIQFYKGFYDIEPLTYLKFDLYNLPYYLVLIGFSLFIQLIVNNKYFGFFLAIFPVVFLPILYNYLEMNDILYRFNSNGPTLPYSALNGFGQVLYSYFIVKSYWILMMMFLLFIALLVFPRGKEKRLSKKYLLSKTSYKLKHKVLLFLFLFSTVGLGAFIYYNTHILNSHYSEVESEKMRFEYEKKYKYLEKIDQPRIVSSNLKIDLSPEDQSWKVDGYYYIKNKHQKAIDSIVIRYPDNLDGHYSFEKIQVSGAGKEIFNDEKSGLKLVKLNNPIQPGDSVSIHFKYEFKLKGFANEAITDIVKNGTFFNSGNLPGLGYNSDVELSENSARKKYGLKPKPRLANVNDQTARMNNYISTDSDWIRFQTQISTDNNQIAIAPGYLQKEWKANKRRYFTYKMDSPILNFYAFLSADYQVKKAKWNNVNIEIYYQKGHEYNLDKMIFSIKNSLTYYTKNFGPYQHRQVRIIEFPRYASFAQSFPNTIPYSESIGFLTKVESEKPEKIDVPFYVTAHEVAHQWWAHQVIGGNVQGSAMMSETFSQYSALMVMEHEYGAPVMKKFLSYELNNYLKGRTKETKKEMPLMLVENQDYIHYNKGSLVMYALKDYLGEAKLNSILKKYLNQTKFQEPPYTNSVEFVNLLKKETPDSLQYLIKDLFETITLNENYIKDLSYKKVGQQYEVKLTVGSVKYRVDGQGKSKKIPVNGYVDIGVFGKKSIKFPEGKELILQKVKIDKPEKSFTFLVDEEPLQAGIDPYVKLIDRNMKNNVHDFKSKPNKVNLDEDEKSGGVGVGLTVSSDD
ncbi:M1 family aminopeptidase [Chryseobacterium sp. ES2]|uniref:M1 family aminopeptidase n=1 Tax=Chryseobacterium metallicongregator TaxID=3073042 RepID=A0ABU1DYJ9_9FLAO|nr:M1 family aminopeptidase [Chryseobacterium sp. ES2]MDR4950623.1 M1 family aminopeptidase [Chryseobacterium sp. ES2]